MDMTGSIMDTYRHTYMIWACLKITDPLDIMDLLVENGRFQTIGVWGAIFWSATVHFLRCKLELCAHVEDIACWKVVFFWKTLDMKDLSDSSKTPSKFLQRFPRPPTFPEKIWEITSHVRQLLLPPACSWSPWRRTPGVWDGQPRGKTAKQINGVRILILEPWK